MKTFTNGLQSRLEQGLQRCASTHNSIEKALGSLQLIESALWELKEFIVSYEFSTLEEEVYFFKEIKTHFIREQIFYDRLLFVEINRPTDNKARLRKYLKRMLDGVDLYFSSNHGFYSYYKMNRQDLDDQLFIRHARPIFSLIPTSRPDLDLRFGNPYSLKLAKIQAYEEIATHLSNLLDYLNTGHQPTVTTDLFWSGTHSQFIELMLALHSKGVINHGGLSYSQLAEKLGSRLGIKPRNLHQVIKNIRNRKKDRTLFLKQLIESAERKMDETDQGI